MGLVELFETGFILAWTFLGLYGLVGLGLILSLAGWLLEKLWWKPRRLERKLRVQGLHGTSYRFPTGDLHRLGKEASSRPLPLRCHDIAPGLVHFMYNSVREHGKTSMFWFGPTPNVLTTDTSIIMDIVSGKSGKIESPRFEAVAKMLTNGLSMQQGDKWANHRKILTPAFRLEKLKCMLPAFSACCEELVRRWTECLGANGSCELDVWPELRNLTGDVISRAAFGNSYLEGMRIFHLQSEQVGRLLSNIWNIVVPGYLYLPTRNNCRMYQINREIEKIIRGLIGKRIQAMKEGECTKHDLLGLLLESNTRHIEENGRSSSGMTIEEVIEHCKLFYFAGMEPTAVLLTWTMVVLSMHPEWQDRAREEVLGLFGKNKPRYEDLSQLKTVTMILYEVLRLYPPSTFLKKKTTTEVEIGGVKYPAGVTIDIPVILIHHDKDNWGNDATEFRPERFAKGISQASKSQGAFLPFGGGARVCIGQNFAILEGKMAICMILQRFQFELANSYTHAPQYVITLHPMHGAQIKLHAI